MSITMFHVRDQYLRSLQRYSDQAIPGQLKKHDRKHVLAILTIYIKSRLKPDIRIFVRVTRTQLRPMPKQHFKHSKAVCVTAIWNLQKIFAIDTCACDLFSFLKTRLGYPHHITTVWRLGLIKICRKVILQLAHGKV